MEEAKKVRLCIISRMRDDMGEMHETKTAHRGLLKTTASGVVIEYDEEQDGEKAHIELTGEKDYAQMLRRGMTSARLCFEPGRRTSSAYVTMYGEIPVAVDTRRVVLDGDGTRGSLTLDYAVFVGGEKTSDVLLEILWRA